MIKALLARYHAWRSDTLPESGAVPPLHQKPAPRPDIALPRERSFWDQRKVVLRINQCPDPFMWYAGKVGGYVPYYGAWPEGYKSREDTGYLNIVKFEDAKIIHVSDVELDICSNCSGSGEGRHEGTSCYVCKGTGEV